MKSLQVCNICNGTGKYKVSTERDILHQINEIITEFVCEQCKGKGKIEDNAINLRKPSWV